jgi:hypothetical protein
MICLRWATIYEVEMPSDDEDMDDEHENVENGEEEDDDDTIFEDKNKDKKSKKNPKASIFADYDEFAHLLKGDL